VNYLAVVSRQDNERIQCLCRYQRTNEDARSDLQFSGTNIMTDRSTELTY